MDFDTGTNLITANLSRASGEVSNGTSVSFRAYQTADPAKDLGRFTGVTTSTDGVVTATFLVDTRKPDETVSLFIEVSGTNDVGQTITQTIEIKHKAD